MVWQSLTEPLPGASKVPAEGDIRCMLRDAQHLDRASAGVKRSDLAAEGSVG